MKKKGIIATIVAIGFIVGIIIIWSIISNIAISGKDNNLDEDYEKTNLYPFYDKVKEEFTLWQTYRDKIEKYKTTQIETLNYAVIQGHYDMVEFLIDAGADINAKDDAGNSPLWLAIKHDQRQITKLLRDKGVDIAGNADRPLIYQALYNEDKKLAKELIKTGANIQAVSEDGEQAIHEASWRGWDDFIQLLVDNGADVDVLVSDGFYKGYTPLHFASEYGRIDTVQLLLDLGANIQIKNNDQQNLLHHVGITGQYEVAKLLLSKSLPINAMDDYDATPLFYAVIYENSRVENLYRDNRGRLIINDKAEEETPHKSMLHIVAEMGDKKLAKTLMDKGMDINIPDEEGLTPLHYAVIYNQIDVAEVFIKGKSNLDFGDDEGKTPLHHASLYGRMYLAEMLIEEGADINHKNLYEKTPLHYVGLYGNTNLTKLLLEKGADINSVDRYGATPLLYAKIYRAEGISEKLIQIGANMFVQGVNLFYDGIGLSPLHLSIRYDNFEIAKMLIEKGANIEGKTQTGETPLHYAIRFDKQKMAFLLLKNGANVNAINNDLKTPLDIALERSDYPMVIMLRGYGGKSFTMWGYIYKMIVSLFD
jgi:serine/threonine-protein phosphatase 6 regulatory ankyrin repeat subunit B